MLRLFGRVFSYLNRPLAVLFKKFQFCFARYDSKEDKAEAEGDIECQHLFAENDRYRRSEN